MSTTLANVTHEIPLEATGEFFFEEQPKTGIQGSGYYRLIDDSLTQYYLPKDTIVYAQIGVNQIDIFAGHRHVTYKDKNDDIDYITEFETSFVFVPNGTKLRQQQIIDLMDEINQTDLDMNNASKVLNSFNPHAGPSGQLEGSSSLVVAGGMQDTKLALATLRNNVTKMKKTLTAKTDQLKSWLSEQSSALAVKAKELSALVSKAENAIWTINLYLGKEEEILHLREGTPAPASQRITIRQKLLYMDEECGLDARDQGIDIQTIAKFDEWLLEDPAHLTQILPENKGIVALHIRSTKKNYDDPWVEAEANKANLSYTYFLIRNGENVYRVYIDMVIGRHLFPSVSEFEAYFWDTEYVDGERVKVPLIPGSEKYLKSMDEADEHRKYYLRIVLVLQGLMDRTPIFKPMATNLINLCDPSHCEEWLHLIYESEKVITDGRPLFSQWQRTINEKLDVGHRIIGIFDYASKIKGDGRYDDGRIYPANACYPTSNVLHTLDEREGDNYIFRYVREKDRVYPRYGSSYTPTTRARCWVEKTDTFMIDFDAVTIEELRYYQGHKLSRASYKDMVPLLEATIALKEAEAADESPFRMLLVGQIMAIHAATHTEAEEQVDELIAWWKFKNRTHRALLSDDKKALDMILTEYGLRQKQKKVRQQIESDKDMILRVICGQTPEPIYVAHKSDNQYVAYIPQNDQNIWVREQVWLYNKQTSNIRCKEEKQWRLVDKRHIRWETLHHTDRWTNWRINPQMATVLTDPEIETLVNAKIEARLAELKPTYSQRSLIEDGAQLRFMPLGAHYNDGFEISLWYSACGPIIPQELIIHTRHSGHDINFLKIGWKRTVNGVVPAYGNEYRPGSFSTEPGERPWDNKGVYVIKVWEDNLKTYADEEKAYDEFKEVRDALVERYSHVEHEVRKLYHTKEVAKAFADFMADFGDPELWPDHLASLEKQHKIRERHFGALDKAIYLLTERGVDIDGWSLSQVYSEAEKYELVELLHRPEMYPSEKDSAPAEYRIAQRSNNE